MIGSSKVKWTVIQASQLSMVDSAVSLLKCLLSLQSLRQIFFFFK